MQIHIFKPKVEQYIRNMENPRAMAEDELQAYRAELEFIEQEEAELEREKYL